MTKTLLLHSKINGGCKWEKIKNLVAQSPRYGKYLGLCADRIFIFGIMRAPLIFSYLEPVYFCNFVLIFMPLRAKKYLKNLGKYATTNSRKNTISKMKALLKPLVLGKENKAQRSVLFSMLGLVLMYFWLLE